ncbi:MAG: trehalose-phosphatase [Betaproteobacteria bacterium]
MIYAFSPEGVACLDAMLLTDPLLAFDIDGTLAPIVARPDQARVPDEIQHCLGLLATRSEVAIITGRSVSDARRMLAFEPRHLIGNHGAEGLPGGSGRSTSFALAVDAWRGTLQASAALAKAGVKIEDKTYSISLHYRGAADPIAARRAITRCLEKLSPKPRVIPGKAVFNVTPADAPDKGEALRTLIAHTRCATVLYVGDDDTDETIFGLNLPNVLSLRVEPSHGSSAALYVRDQREVLKLVQHIVRTQSGTSPA